MGTHLDRGVHLLATHLVHRFVPNLIGRHDVLQVCADVRRVFGGAGYLRFEGHVGDVVGHMCARAPETIEGAERYARLFQDVADTTLVRVHVRIITDNELVPVCTWDHTCASSIASGQGA